MGIEVFVNTIFRVYYALIFVRILLSFVPHNTYQPLIRFIYEVTEPWLGIFRRLVPPLGMIDISPLIAFFALELARQLVLILLHFVGII
jgi:YggT family protein